MFSSSTPCAGGSRGSVMNNSSAIQHIPFSANLSNLSLELGRNDSSLATSPVGSDVTSISGGSFRDCHQRRTLEDENFKLKLRVYMLEERLQRQCSPQKNANSGPTNVGPLRQALAQKQELLQRASAALEELERRHSSQTEKQQAERADLQQQLTEARDQLTEARDQLTEARHQLTEARHQLTDVDQQQQQQQVAALRVRLSETARRHQRAEQECRRLRAALQRSCISCREVVRHPSGEAEPRSPPPPPPPQNVHAATDHLVSADKLTELCAKPAGTRDKHLQITALQVWNKENVPFPTVNQTSADAAVSQLQCTPERCLARREVSSLRRQLAAAAAQRRRQMATAAAQLQLQTERARSLQASCHRLSEQLRSCSGRLPSLQTPAAQYRDSQVAASSTEVEVIAELEMPQLVSAADDDSRHSQSRAGDSRGPQRRHQGTRDFQLQTHDGLSAAPRHDQSKPTRPTTLQLSPSVSSGVNQRPASCSVDRLAAPLTQQAEDCDSWSEPDRDVSWARIGLTRGCLQPPAGLRGRAEAISASDTDRGEDGGRRAHSAEAQQLESRVQALQQLQKLLCAEVAVYRQMLPPGGDRHKLQVVASVPPSLLKEIGQLRQRLVSAVIRHQVPERRHYRRSSPPPELALALTITQEALTESTHKLTEMQQRNQKLKSKLQRLREDLKSTEQERDQIHQECDSALDNMRLMQQDIDKLETECRQLQQLRAADREQLQRAAARQQQLEQLVQQLSEQLQSPAAAAAEQEQVQRAEAQLVQLASRRLQLLAESARLRSSCRLLRTEAALLRSERAEWSPAARERLQINSGGTAPELSWSGGTAPELSWNGELPELSWNGELPELERTGERRHLERRLGAARAAGGRADLSLCEGARIKGQARIDELVGQLETLKIELQQTRLNVTNYDDGGHSCTESARSCDLPVGTCRPSVSGSDCAEPSTRGRTAAYSSPDLGIDSDCQRSLSRCSDTTAASPRPLPGGFPSKLDVVGSAPIASVVPLRTGWGGRSRAAAI